MIVSTVYCDIHLLTHVQQLQTTIRNLITQTRHVTVRRLLSSSGVSHSALLLVQTVCVIPMPTKPLYTQFYTSPRFNKRAPLVNSYSIPVGFLTLFVICFSNVVSSISRLSTRAPPAAIDVLCSLLSLMSFYSRHASYVCAICCDRCALDVFCFFSIFLSSFIPCVIAFVIRRTFTVTPPGLFSRIS